jgi:surface carbohydrate biosynthesis protein (TIGR04326 family)
MLILWDSPNSLPINVNNDIIYTWDGYVENNYKFSLFKTIEANDNYYKNKYLQWIYKFGQFNIKGKKLIDHLTFNDSLSYWWMTIFVEKNPWKQNTINDAIRLLALENILKINKPSTLKLVSDNNKLRTSIKIICKKLGVKLICEKSNFKKTQSYSFYKKVYNFLPNFIRALLILFHYLKSRWNFRKSTKKELFSENAVFFCSYFFNLNQQKVEKGEYCSAYWGNIIDLLNKNGLKSNWLQHYIPYYDIPNAKIAIKKSNQINLNKNTQGVHFFLEENLSYKIIILVFRKYLFLFKKFLLLKKIRSAFTPDDSFVDFWPIMKDDWSETLIGPSAVFNLFNIELFDKLLAGASNQKKGIFLYENQSWEKAFIHSWRKYNHGKIIAVAHSTVRYWDLRYFDDIKTVNDLALNSMPQADLVALNGRVSRESYISNGFPIEKIIDCEAIRFSFTNSIDANTKKEFHNNKLIRILILGDYLPASTNKLLNVVGEAFNSHFYKYHFTIKPHPNYIISSENFQINNLKVIVDPLNKIMHNYDIVISGNSTSAAVDAYIFGLPIVILIDEKELNFSPLRNQVGVYFAYSPIDLFNYISKFNHYEVHLNKSKDFFYFNENLPKWNNILLH